MMRPRDLADFEVLWDRRTIYADDAGVEFHLLSIPDLVTAKKTQRSRDWPVIERLVVIHHRENSSYPRADWIKFWLLEARLIVRLCADLPAEAATLEARRPVLKIAQTGDPDELRAALDAEVRVEQAKDREYWQLLRKELEQFRFEE